MTPITTKELGKIYQEKDWTVEELQKMHGVDVTFKADNNVICTGKISAEDSYVYVVHNNKNSR